MRDDTGPAPVLGRRAEATAYLAAFLSISQQPMANVVVPLWALSLGVSPLMLGVAMGARSLLPFLFAIHGGVLIDRLGARRVMMACAGSTIVTTLLYPLLPSIAALVALQIVVGLSNTLGWIGAQTHTGRLTRGHPLYIGRFTFVSTIANFIGPLAIGTAWDFAGPWGAFGLLSLWSAALTVVSATLREPEKSPDRGRVGLRGLMPAFADYRNAFAMALVPAVGFVVAGSFLINATFSMRFAFYVVYLEHLGMQGTLIGTLVGIASLSGAIFALFLGPATRRIEPGRLLVLMIVIASIGMGATPLFRGFPGLFAFACLFGLGTGLGMALIYAELSRSAPAHRLGTSIGLRTTANRFSSLSIPVLMGAIVQIGGLSAGFFVLAGLIALGALAGLALLRPDRAPTPETAD